MAVGIPVGLTQKALLNFVMSVRPLASARLPQDIFPRKLDIGDYHKNLSRKSKFG